MASEYVPPTNRELALTHARAIVRAAVVVAVTRQEQLAAEADMAQQLSDLAQAGKAASFHARVLDSTRLVETTAALDHAVDALTQACIEAQVAAEARNN